MQRVSTARFTAGLVAAAFAVCGGRVLADDEDWGRYQQGALRSGYTYAAAETRAMQDDDFENPGFIWIDRGAELWSEARGRQATSCASCHADAAESMRTVGARYPVFAPEIAKLINVEQRINQCAESRMGAAPFAWESDELLSLTAFVRHQARGLPVAPEISGPAAPFYARGKSFYETRRGQLDLACTNCHEWLAGRMLRADLLSQGHSNGFPLYRLKWQTLGSLQRRLRRCNEQVRAEPYPYGADEYVNLELFLAARGRGLPVETPAVRR